MASCSYCQAPLGESDRYCPRCGQETAIYQKWLRQVDPPPAPTPAQRWALQGGPALRVVLALLAVLMVATPGFLLIEDEDAGLYFLLIDSLVALAILAVAIPQRRMLEPLLKTPGPAWVWLVGLVGAYALPTVSLWIYGQFGMDPGPQESAWFEISPAVLVISFCLFPGVFEELAFRGIFLGTVVHMMSASRAHLLTAAVFAGIHFNQMGLPYLFVVGLFLGWLRHTSKSLYPAMVAHAAHNAVVLFL